MIDATLKGLRSVIDREDVPAVKEILSLREKSHMHYLNLPFLGGLGRSRKDGTGRRIPMGRQPDSQGSFILLLYTPWRI